MSFDLSQFHAVFFEEAAEHLAALEALLLRVVPQQAQAEEVAELFRRAHSVKGAAATFGFQDMAALTHVMESLLDAVRKGRLPLDHARIDACLAAVDVLRRQLAAHREGAPSDPVADQDVRGRLESLCASPSRPAVAPAADAEDALELRFVVSRLVAGSEALTDNALDELAALGELVAVDRPEPGAGDAEWHVRLRSSASDAALHGVLDFLAEPGSLRIERGGSGAHSAQEASPPALVEEAEDGSWGFFEPVPPAAPPPPTTPSG